MQQLTTLYRAALNFGLCTFFGILGMPAQAESLYSQPLITNPSGFYSNQNGQEAADQFILSCHATINTVTWYGFFETDLEPSVTHLGFELTFYSDGGKGLPGKQLTTQTVSASVLDTGLVVTEPGLLKGRKVYEFSYEISDLSAIGGQVVWLSIVRDPFDPNEWLWSYSPYTSTDRKAYRLGDGPWQPETSFGQISFMLEGLFDTPCIFTDGFEAGDMRAWSTAAP